MEDKNKILTLTDVSIGYTGRNTSPVFSHINVGFSRGELVAVIGKNGIGKSTLLRTVAGLQEPLSGNITLDGRELHSYSRLETATRIGFVSTEPVRVNNMYVADLVALGRYPYTGWLGKLNSDDWKKVLEALEMVGMQGFVKRNFNEISDGERQRAMIARTLAQDTDLIILDEPTAFLDMPAKYEIISLLCKLVEEKKKSVIFTTHDLNTAMQSVDRMMLMDNEAIITGAPEDLALAGYFDLFSDKDKITFDREAGDFRIVRTPEHAICLVGEGIERIWTERALFRAGFKTGAPDDLNGTVFVTQNDGVPEWALKKGSDAFIFKSVYEMAACLRGMI
ncbi:MAG: ABC transporter ATP-binding protein [Bacteroidetes bacterium]|nr:ABC transporter ATP-binding protein [Bacteroidota bacterium]